MILRSGNALRFPLRMIIHVGYVMLNYLLFWEYLTYRGLRQPLVNINRPVGAAVNQRWGGGDQIVIIALHGGV